ncbi:MAG: GNAT family N-acetyltransferase [Elusimicrobiota bacterium]
MIKPLSAPEIEKASHLAAAAFREDPGFSYLIPDDALRRYRLPSLIEALLRVDAASGGRVQGAFDGDALIGVSATLPAGAANPDLRDWLSHWRGLSWMLKDPAAVLRALALVDAMERQRPDSVDYLHLLAVHPATQGRGVGAALIRDALKGGNTLYLETFTPQNVAWYEARGFKRLKEVNSPVRPTFWTLKRQQLTRE